MFNASTIADIIFGISAMSAGSADIIPLTSASKISQPADTKSGNISATFCTIPLTAVINDVISVGRFCCIPSANADNKFIPKSIAIGINSEPIVKILLIPATTVSSN
ncbi:hypothetical protein SDC9_168339 [bioreactor metagenome]|uniref:Uncharacterized protein n=1 Tax=bioreactor metagenome TaxID=1076179 RepID=A0A645G4W9_9ZZZZ